MESEEFNNGQTELVADSERSDNKGSEAQAMDGESSSLEAGGTLEGGRRMSAARANPPLRDSSLDLFTTVPTQNSSPDQSSYAPSSTSNSVSRSSPDHVSNTVSEAICEDDWKEEEEDANRSIRSVAESSGSDILDGLDEEVVEEDEEREFGGDDEERGKAGADKDDDGDKIGAEGVTEEEKERRVEEMLQHEVREPYYANHDYLRTAPIEGTWAEHMQDDHQLKIQEEEIPPVEIREDQKRVIDSVNEDLEWADEEETEEEILERIQVQQERIKDIENKHFYTPFTGKFPKNKVLKAVARIDARRAVEFVRHAEEQLSAKAHTYENLPERNSNPLRTTLEPTSSHAIIGMVVFKEGGRAYTVTPLHVEVVGGKRFHLQYMRLTSSTYDVCSDNLFDMDKVQLGDLIWIETIVPFPEGDRKRMVTKPEDVNDMNKHKFWKIQNAALLPRIMVNGRYARRMRSGGFTRFKYLAEDIALPAKLDTVISSVRGFEAAEWLIVDVMVPMVLPGINVRDFKPRPQDEEEARRLFNVHRPVWEINPVILKTYPVPDEDFAKFKLGAEQFSCRGDAVMDNFRWISRVVRVAVWGQAALSNIRFDPRSYPTEVVSAIRTIHGNTLAMRLECPQFNKIKIIHWRRNTPINIDLNGEKLSAVVLSALEFNTGFIVVVKLTRAINVPVESYIESRGIICHKKHEIDESIRMQIGKLQPPRYNEKQPAMNAIVATHGGNRIVDTKIRKKKSFAFGSFKSTQDQGVVYEMLSDPSVPAMIMNCAFGSGKTSTMVAAVCKIAYENKDKYYVYTGQSNCSAVQGVKCWTRIDDKQRLRIVRFITPGNRAWIDAAWQTPHDWPVLLWPALRAAFDRANRRGRYQTALTTSIARHLHNKGKIHRRIIVNDQLWSECGRSYKEDPPEQTIMECFMRAFKPNLIFGTSTSIRQMFMTNTFMKQNRDRVPLIMVDEASILVRSAILALAFAFPDSRLFFSGDDKQLTPYSEHELPSDLEYAVSGSVFKTAIERQSLPVITVREVFRCPPPLTIAISNAFYEGTLIARREWNPEDGIIKRLGFKSSCPIKFLHTSSQEEREGTSIRNIKEALITKKLVQHAIDKAGVPPQKIMVLAFYLAQASLVSSLLPKDVRVATVDASQGSEFEFVIILTSKRMDFIKSPFLDSPQRVTVAFSRAICACICLYNLQGIHNSRAWAKLKAQIPGEEFLLASDFNQWYANPNEVNDFAQTLMAAEVGGETTESFEVKEKFGSAASGVRRKREENSQESNSSKFRK